VPPVPHIHKFEIGELEYTLRMLSHIGTGKKTKLKRMKGVVFDELSSYLDEFMWRERWGKTSRAI